MMINSKAIPNTKLAKRDENSIQWEVQEVSESIQLLNINLERVIVSWCQVAFSAQGIEYAVNPV